MIVWRSSWVQSQLRRLLPLGQRRLSPTTSKSRTIVQGNATNGSDVLLKSSLTRRCLAASGGPCSSWVAHLDASRSNVASNAAWKDSEGIRLCRCCVFLVCFLIDIILFFFFFLFIFLNSPPPPASVFSAWLTVLVWQQTSSTTSTSLR